MRNFFILAALASLAACQGSIPIVQEGPSGGLAAVVIGGRFNSPDGPTNDGESAITLESRDGETYRLPIKGGQTLLYQIEPGIYHLVPPRSAFGNPEKFLYARVNGRNYKTPFPQEIVNEAEFTAKSSQITTLGVLDIDISAPLPGRGPLLRVNLDDFVEDKRGLIQNLIRLMMDPAASPELRQNSQAWLDALQKALISLAAQPQTPFDRH